MLADRSRGDYVAIIEAAYQLETDEATWMAGVTAAIEATMKERAGVWAMLYDVSTPSLPRVARFHYSGSSPGFVPGFVTRLLAGRDATGRPVFGASSCALASESAAVGHEELRDWFRSWGIADALGVNGADPSGLGVFLGINLPSLARMSERRRRLWSRIGAHATTGYRLRRRLALARTQAEELSDGDAILHGDGTLAHGGPEARSPASRHALREAVVAVDRTRGRLRREAPDEAVAEWKGLAGGRWTLVDRFDRDGRRYVVARRNEPHAPAIEGLSERERQVVAFARLGHQNKLIAYELGIAISTVGVLLSRAMAKLGVRNRKALIAALEPRSRP